MEAPSFGSPEIMDWLDAASAESMDELSFGAIAMRPDGTVERYSRAEAALSGLTPARVVGRNFFTAVAPCTNNYLVAHRFEAEAALDATIDYVFTLRMKPTPVTLRLLKRPASERMYLLVARRSPHAG